jgi:mRNA-degrading endonuclease toxin of MazEF toxin-antitoxin module
VPGRARWGQVWRVDAGLDEPKRYAVVSENGWNETFPSVLGVRLSASPRRRPGPGFPLISERPRVVAICGQITSLDERQLLEPLGALAPKQMRAIAIGVLEVTQLHRLLGMTHPEIAERIGEPRSRGR